MEKLHSSRFTEWILNIVLMFMLGFVGLLIYWQFAEYEVLTPLEGNYTLDKYTFKNGEDFNIHFQICKNMQIPEDIYGRFVDGVIYPVPENSSDFEVGCYDTYITSVSIPHSLPEGKYTYQEDVMYQVNPIREIKYTFSTPEFEIVK